MATIILSFLISFIILLIATPVVIKCANRASFIANPTSERWHSKPTALLGGIGIFIGILAGLLASGVIFEISWGLTAGIILIFLSGLYDDVFNLSPFIKLIIQISAGILVISSGILIGKGFIAEYIAVPLTIFWIVGITNAMNLLDNMDGLCSGVSGIIAFFLGFIFLINNQLNPAILSFVISGASFGFLVYNFNPAKIFMGDCGSLLLGFSLSVLSLLGSYQMKSHVLLSLSIPLLIMALPIFDTTLVTLNRKIINRPVSQGGKDHSSHRLIALGYSEKQSALILYGITALGGTIAITLNYINVSISLMLIIVSLIIFVGSGAFFTRVRVYSKEEYLLITEHNKTDGKITPIKTVLNYKRQIIEVLFDTIFILYGFYFATWIQSTGDVTSNFFFNFRLLPVLIIYSLIVFYFFGFYKLIWRYISIEDLIKYGTAIILITISLIIFKYLFGYSELQLTTCILFGIILSYLALGFRLSERIFSILIRRNANNRSATSKRILIVGAGDTGNLFISEIHQNQELGIYPIGFVDDDPTKIGSSLCGIPILGNLHEIEDIIRKKHVDEIIIAISNIEDEILGHINGIGRKSEVPVKRVQIGLKTI